MLMQNFKDAGYHVELVTDKDNKKSIYVSLYPIKHGKDTFSKTFDSLAKAFEFINTAE